MMDKSAFFGVPKVRTEPDEFFVGAVNSTYEYLLETVNLALTEDVRRLILMQSVHGRMMEGFWDPKTQQSFERVCYRNTILENVFEALGEDVHEVQVKRQDIIDDKKRYILSLFDDVRKNKNGNCSKKHSIKPVNLNGKPIGGVLPFQWMLIHNPIEFLIGAYIGGCFDSAEWRARTEKKYGVKIHQGICRPVHFERLKENGLSLDDLSRLSSNEEINIEKLSEARIITDSFFETYKNGYVNGFLELSEGFGLSDDAGYIGTYLKFGKSAALGFISIDFIDSWDKSAPKIYYGGQDENIARDIKPKYENIYGEGTFPCTDEDVMEIIYLASSADASVKKDYPSSSQRRFLQIDPETGLCALESHNVFAESFLNGGIRPPQMKLAFQQVSSDRFYDMFEKKWSEIYER